jgi:SAM-dependent methyltransferase
VLIYGAAERRSTSVEPRFIACYKARGAPLERMRADAVRMRVTSWGSSEGRDAWLRASEERARMMAPVTARMLALAKIHEGARVLELGAGAGEVALLLGAAVGSGGSVLAVDVSPYMVEATIDAARAARLPQVDARIADAQALDLPAEAFDAAIARNVLMFVEDLQGTLSSVRRLLRKGGRFVASTWAEPEVNGLVAIVFELIRGHGHEPDRSLELVRAFSLSDPTALGASFARAGFVEVSVERVSSVRSFAGCDAVMALVRENPSYSELLGSVNSDDREAILDRIRARCESLAAEDGSMCFPIELLVIAAEAP